MTKNQLAQHGAWETLAPDPQQNAQLSGIWMGAGFKVVQLLGSMAFGAPRRLTIRPLGMRRSHVPWESPTELGAAALDGTTSLLLSIKACRYPQENHDKAW